MRWNFRKRKGSDSVGVRRQREPLATGDGAFGVEHLSPKRRRANACRRTPHLGGFVVCPKISATHGWMPWPLLSDFPNDSILRDSCPRRHWPRDRFRASARSVSPVPPRGWNQPAPVPRRLQRQGLSSRAWQPAIVPLAEIGACPAGATTLRSAQKMKITYTPIWKRTTRGSVLCGGLGFLAGSACGLWMPHALIAAGVLAIIAGMIFDEGTVIENSFLFVMAGAMGMITTMDIGDPYSPSSIQARHFASATPWQIVWVIPLQIIGYGLRFLVRRMLRQPHAEQAVSGNRR